MRTLFSGQVFVSYSQMYLSSDGTLAGLDESMSGQTNGLCGGAFPGFVFLTTGLHTGKVDVQVEAHEAAPPIDDHWQEVVEVSFKSTHRASLWLVGWGGGSGGALDLERGDYRLRYCVSGMDEGHGAQMQRERVAERYLLQLWPAPPSPDRVLRQTSAMAAYWHNWVRELEERRHRPPPTPEEQQQQAQRQLEQFYDDALSQLGADLATLIGGVATEKQRSVAQRATHLACESAGLTHVDWIAPALAAMDQGQPLPDPFTDGEAMTRRLLSDERIRQTPATWLDGGTISNSQQDLAVHALRSAVKTDARRAAIETVVIAALSCDDREKLLATVRGWLEQ